MSANDTNELTNEGDASECVCHSASCFCMEPQAHIEIRPDSDVEIEVVFDDDDDPAFQDTVLRDAAAQDGATQDHQDAATQERRPPSQVVTKRYAGGQVPGWAQASPQRHSPDGSSHQQTAAAAEPTAPTLRSPRAPPQTSQQTFQPPPSSGADKVKSRPYTDSSFSLPLIALGGIIIGLLLFKWSSLRSRSQ